VPLRLVGSEMCIRDSFEPFPLWQDMPFLDASEMQRQDNDWIC
jgi:hypothetical protein